MQTGRESTKPKRPDLGSSSADSKVEKKSSNAYSEEPLPDKASKTADPPSNSSEAFSDFERVASEFADRVRQGLPATVEQFVTAHPQFADEIRELFPVILAMERHKLDQEGANPQSEFSDDLPLERLGDCRIVREIGRGGMGIVFEALRAPKNERVAVKLLPGRAIGMTHWKERFEQEARTVESLRHANIVSMLGFGEENGHSYFIMPYIDGVTLDWVIQRLTEKETLLFEEEIELSRKKQKKSSLSAADSAAAMRAISSGTSTRGVRQDSWKLFARIAGQVAKALSYAHRQGVLHNDIKPGNLLLDATGRVWVSDFGLAQPLDPPADREWRSVAGTLRYMAPERFSGWFDELSDLYSLGITLYELVTRRPAFEAANRKALIDKIAKTEPLAPRKINSDIPRDLETIILTAIRRNPDERYYSVEAFADDLLRFINGERIRAKRPSRWRSWWSNLRRRWIR